MKKLLIILILIIHNNIFSQVTGIVRDISTNTPVGYSNIWLENEEIGTTSDENGKFEFNDTIKNKILIVSALGYERTKIFVDSTNLNVFLSHIIYPIPEVRIKPNSSESITIVHFKKRQIVSFTCPTTPQIYSKLIPFKEEYTKYSFIKSIKFTTRSLINSKIRIRILEVNENGEPENDLMFSDVIVNIKKGTRINKVNIDEFENVQFPTVGVFIAFEFLIIEENKYLFKNMVYKLKDGTEMKHDIIGFMPALGELKFDPSAINYIYTSGKWTSAKTYNKTNFAIEMEIMRDRKTGTE